MIVLLELHRLDVGAAAVTIDDAFGRHDLFVSDAVLVIAAIGAVHDEAPDTARPKVEAHCRRGKTVRPPPLRQMFRIGEGRENEVARRVEFANADDRT